MRFHVVSLPHTQTTAEFSACAYTEKIRKFCIMMKDRGHAVFLYAGEQNEAPCDELITCISEVERAKAVGDAHYTSAPFDPTLPHWGIFNKAAASAISDRSQTQDFVCLIAGTAHKPVADALPDLMSVEFGIGYGGTFSRYRVFESYAWMHTVYGAQAGNPCSADGIWYDEVIPGYLEPEKFPFSSVQDDYYLYIGRMIDRKGYHIAVDACRAKGVRLLTAGPGCANVDSDLGVVGPERRGQLMSRAIAVFMPTIYIEPFGNVSVEAMACGTPVITSDWGAFTETVAHGVDGYRCRMFRDFLAAMENVKQLNRQNIRDRAIARFSLGVVGRRYEEYFERLLTLWTDGWYSK